MPLDPASVAAPGERTGDELNIMIVAGEASGDLHGATLATALREENPRVRCFGIGGDRMASAGVEILYHMRHLAVVGFAEVLWHLRDVRRAMRMLTHAATGELEIQVFAVDGAGNEGQSEVIVIPVRSCIG